MNLVVIRINRKQDHFYLNCETFKTHPLRFDKVHRLLLSGNSFRGVLRGDCLKTVVQLQLRCLNSLRFSFLLLNSSQHSAWDVDISCTY